MDTNPLESILESLLVSYDKQTRETNELLDLIVQALGNKKEGKLTLDGVEKVTIKGEKGEQGEKGDKGDKGDQGEKGEQGPKGEDSNVPGPQGEQGVAGRDGRDGRDGEDGKDGKDGRDGEDGTPGKDGSPDTGEQIVKKLSSLKDDSRLSYESLKDRPNFETYRGKGGGPGYLREISDVAVSNIQDGQSIRYNTTTANWEPYTPGSGGVVSWGDIEGDISDQTDLQDALGLKANTADLGVLAFQYVVVTDGVTITGTGTDDDPLVAPGGGFSGTEGSVPFVGPDGLLTENNDNFFFDNDNIQLRVGTVDDVYSGASTDSLLVSQEIDDYSAITVRNRSNGTSASADLVVSNDLDDGGIFTGVYGNLGIASSTYTRDSAELVKPNDTYLEAFGGDLLIQSYTPGKVIQFTTGGDLIENLRLEISDTLSYFLANYDADIIPTFTGGNWTGTNGWSVSGGDLVLVSDASDGTMQPSTPLTVGIGTTYKITIETSAVSGTVNYSIGGVTGTAITGATTVDRLTALTTDNFIITGLAGSTATITSIVVQPLINDTGDVFVEGNLTVGSTIKTLSGEDVFNINGEAEVTFPNYLPFGPSGVSPTLDYHLVTKQYADTLFSSGARFVDDVRAGTTTALPACTYNNGTSGVGATLTGDANGALSAQDGVTLTVDQMLLVKNQANQAHNGVYVLTQVGDGSNPFILTRLGTYDTTAEIVTGTFFTILAGSTLALSQWSMNNDTTITVGTTDITFAQLSAPLTYIGGDGIDIASTTISVLLDTTPGLEFNAGALRVKPDDATIENSAGGVRVKDGGITATKLVGGGVPEAPASGAINGSNRVFVFTQTPLYINLNGMNYYEDNGYTLSGLTVTFDVVLTPPTGSIIRNHYV